MRHIKSVSIKTPLATVVALTHRISKMKANHDEYDDQALLSYRKMAMKQQ